MLYDVATVSSIVYWILGKGPVFLRLIASRSPHSELRTTHGRREKAPIKLQKLAIPSESIWPSHGERNIEQILWDIGLWHRDLACVAIQCQWYRPPLREPLYGFRSYTESSVSPRFYLLCSRLKCVSQDCRLVPAILFFSFAIYM